MASKVMIPMAEFDELVEPDGLRYELDEGELIVMTRPRTFHNHIAGNFFMSLKLYLRNRPIGTVFNSDQLYQLGPSTKRAPDVPVVLKPRVVGRNEELNGAPDLAIKVISPSESHPAIHRWRNTSAPDARWPWWFTWKLAKLRYGGLPGLRVKCSAWPMR